MTRREQVIRLAGTALLAVLLVFMDDLRIDEAPSRGFHRRADRLVERSRESGRPSVAAAMVGRADSQQLDDGDGAEEDRIAPKLEKLTTKQINRIRYMELRGMRLNTQVPDRVSVKISRETIDDFLIEMEGHPRFRGRKRRQEFYKKTAPQKAHIIAHYKGASYADKVEILSDPEIFVEFRRNVMPLVLRGCASNGCHSRTNDEAIGFRLFKDPKKTPATTYANFIVLSDLQVAHRPMIDRGRPPESLLLTYMLPRKEVRPKLRHPGDVEYKPVFRSRKAPKFSRLEKWIAALKEPREDYGVHLLPQRVEPEARKDSPESSE